MENRMETHICNNFTLLSEKPKHSLRVKIHNKHCIDFYMLSDKNLYTIIKGKAWYHNANWLNGAFYIGDIFALQKNKKSISSL